MSFHTFSLLEDRCVRLLVKNLGRHAWRGSPGGGGEYGHLCLGSFASTQGAPWTGGLKSPSPNKTLCCDGSTRTGSGESAFPDRVSVETYVAPKKTLQLKRCQRSGHTQGYCGYAPPVLLVVRLTSQGYVPPNSSSLRAAAVQKTTHPTTGAEWNRKSPRRRLLSGRLSNAVSWVVHPTFPLPQRQNGRAVRRAGKSVIRSLAWLCR